MDRKTLKELLNIDDIMVKDEQGGWSRLSQTSSSGQRCTGGWSRWIYPSE